MIIAIDGPAGAGKSTTALEVARRLGYLHVDSGALYRAYAVAACRRGWASPAGVVPAERVSELAAQEVAASVEDGTLTAYLDGRRLGDDLRSPSVTACSSKISAFPAIRQRVNDLLRHLVAEHGGGVVCEGRDMGTVVFPDAELKVFMVASAEERAKRRLQQRGESVTSSRIKEEARRLEARDRADSERAVSPLRRADGAIEIDTTHLSFDEQVERILAAASEAGARLDTR